MTYCEWCNEEFDDVPCVHPEIDMCEFCSNECANAAYEEVKYWQRVDKEQYELYGDDLDSWYRQDKVMKIILTPDTKMKFIVHAQCNSTQDEFWSVFNTLDEAREYADRCENTECTVHELILDVTS